MKAIKTINTKKYVEHKNNNTNYKNNLRWTFGEPSRNSSRKQTQIIQLYKLQTQYKSYTTNRDDQTIQNDKHKRSQNKNYKTKL